MFNSAHQPTIMRVTPFPDNEGAGLAAVTLGYGPVVIRAKLAKNKKGDMFLMMPARKNSEEKWFDQAYITDTGLVKEFENLAIQQYRSPVSYTHLTLPTNREV